MIGQRAQVKQSFAMGETGSIFVAGEWWNAELSADNAPNSSAVQAGEEVEITGRKGYTLLVRRI